MGYISFYRKWRPQTFDDVVGQKYNMQTLKNVLDNNRLSHSYIFCGPRGTGKTSTARILAKAINCIDGITSKPCNKCQNCVSISDGSNVDVIEIDAASNRGINEIRELREKVKYLPNNLRRKVYIIDEVHMLTTEAFNALLKVLEEPPEHVIFIMATTEPNKVLPTIMSRCQRFDFYPITIDLISERLKSIAKSEKLSISDQALGLISRYADGSLRDADGMLEQLAAYSEEKIEPKDVVALLGVVDLEVLFQFVDTLISGNTSNGLEMVRNIIKSNQNLKVFVSELLDHLYNIYVIKNYDKPSEVVDISKDYLEKYSKQAEKIQNEEIEYYLDHFTELLKQVKWGESSKTFFRTAVIQAVNYIVLDEKQIDKKIKAWESKIHSLQREVKSGVRMEVSGGQDTDVGEVFNKPHDLDFLNSTDEPKAGSETQPSTEIGSTDKVMQKNKIVIDPEPEKPAKKPAMKVKKQSVKGKGLEAISENLEKILILLKRKKISVHAMFVESEPNRIEDKTIIFHLEENKNWHRDHLNKKANLNIISEVISEVTGKKYMVKFELGKIDSRKQMKNHAGQDITVAENKKPDSFRGGSKPDKKDPGTKKTENIKAEKTGSEKAIPSGKPDRNRPGTNDKKKGENITESKKEGTKQADGNEKDMLKYFEEKFEIKE